jgi:hypothetical protein
MKIKFTFLLILLATLKSFSQGPGWEYAAKADGTADERSTSLVTDATGNLYIIGYTESPTFTLGGITISNNGGQDGYLFKLDPSGTAIWGKAIGGSGDEQATALALDNNGNVYVTGYFTSNAITFGTTTLNNPDPVEIFVAKFSGAGNPIWAKNIGAFGSGQSNLSSTGIGTDLNGHVYLTGWFNGSLIGFGQGNNISNTNAASYDGFVSRFDTSGSFNWATHFGGSSNEFPYGIAIDHSGIVYITGIFSSTNFQFGTSTLATGGAYDSFVLKYDGIPNEVWGVSLRGTGDEIANSIAVDQTGFDIFVTGYFSSSSMTDGVASINNGGARNIFIGKYSTSGSTQWLQKQGSNGFEYGQSIQIDANNKIFVTGGTSSQTLTLGSTTLNNYGGSNGLYDTYVTEIDRITGAPVWALNAGGSNYDQPNVVVSDGQGSVYVTGFTSSAPCNFGTHSISWTGTMSTYDIYLAKINLTTGLKELMSAKNIELFPNPATNELNIISNSSLAKIEIKDLLGKSIYSISEINSLSKSINTESFESGIYLIQIYSEGNMVTKNFIKQ